MLVLFYFIALQKNKLIDTADIFSISGKKDFEKITMKVFRHQYGNNLVYQKFCDLLV